MNITPLAFHAKNRLAVVQFATEAHDTIQYISADRAMKDALLEVREVNEAGSVNTLLVMNSGELPVFLMDGDILIGAKQNRVINTSVLLRPKAKSTLPVSCVEGGRWRYVSDSFAPSDYTAPASLRSAKSRQVTSSLEQNRGHFSDQGAIWDNVAAYHRRHAVQSSTSSLSDIYEGRRTDYNSFFEAFEIKAGSNGCAFFVDKKLASVDLFNRLDIYEEYFPKLLRGIGIEMAHLAAKGDEIQKTEADYRVIDFFDTLSSREMKKFKGVSMGEERRFASDEQTGFALYLDEEIVHLSALRELV